MPNVRVTQPPSVAHYENRDLLSERMIVEATGKSRRTVRRWLQNIPPDWGTWWDPLTGYETRGWYWGTVRDEVYKARKPGWKKGVKRKSEEG